MNLNPRAALVGAMIVCAVPWTRAADDGSATKTEVVRFKRAAWKKGDEVTSKLTADGSLTISMAVKGEVVQHFEQKNHEVTQKKVVVLKTDDDGPTKLSVHYTDVVESQLTDGDESSDAKETSPLAGRTFLLEKTAKGVTITDDAGTVVGEEVAALVRQKELSRDGAFERGFDRLAALVSESPRAVGKKIDVPDDIALELVSGDEDLKDAHMKLKLVEVREVEGARCGVFAAELHLSGTAGGDDYRTTVELEGEIAFVVDGARCVSAELSGKIAVDGAVQTDDTSVTVSGEGPLKIVQTATYGRDEH
jgi:hypothetical protein